MTTGVSDVNSKVSICSNAIGVNPVYKTQRYSQNIKKNVSQPQLIHRYNKNIGGIA